MDKKQMKSQAISQAQIYRNASYAHLPEINNKFNINLNFKRQ